MNLVTLPVPFHTHAHRAPGNGIQDQPLTGFGMKGNGYCLEAAYKAGQGNNLMDRSWSTA
jgi:hypothetical protein